MKNIALAFSGGGFRAAAFSLGTLSYLNQLQPPGWDKPLLNNVKFIGSTSGGSMTNIAYSIGVFQGDEFSVTYKALLAAMEGETLIARVFEILKAKQPWEGRDTKSRNLINAFSIAYDEKFGAQTFKNLYEPGEGIVPHLEEVCINSTEFTNGVSFRFQSQQAGISNGLVGNYYIYFKDLKVAGDLKLGDLMACSSCFSGGFEPFIFPDDFVHAGLSRQGLLDAIIYESNPFTITDTDKELLSNETFKDIKERFGLMDGGVADNQAIDSVFKANDRRKGTGKEFDLVVLTDVGSYFVDGYTLPMEKKRWYNAFTVQQVINMIKLAALSFVIIAVFAAIRGWHEWMKFVFIPLAVLAISYIGGVIFLALQKKQAFKTKSTWLVVMFNYIDYFLTIRVSRLKQMVTSRLKSVFLLADDLYLKQIRRLYYNMIYADKDLGPMTISNAIYDLSNAKLSPKTDEKLAKTIDAPVKELNAKPVIQELEQRLKDIAEKARSMPTTLWFDPFQQDELAGIVATGQFTTCYNLLKYYLKQPALSTEEAALVVQLTRDWKAFNDDPYILYKKLT
ncbi:MAG: hypothetical protein JWP44_3768 [Mucilaginibacter sp.]|nr:hypothetical protein [Mucilaginibacter sp.]